MTAIDIWQSVKPKTQTDSFAASVKSGVIPFIGKDNLIKIAKNYAVTKLVVYDNSEVIPPYTPMALLKEITDKLVGSVDFLTAKFLVIYTVEWANYLQAIHGVPVGNITVVGDPKRIDIATYQGYNVINSLDFLSDEFNKDGDLKFDVIVGNPPYQLGKNSNFYVDFIKKSVDVLRKGDSLCFIVPNRFILPHHDSFTILNKHFEVKELWVDVNEYFTQANDGKKIGQNIGYVYATRCRLGNSGTTKIKLADNATIDVDLKSTMIPSKMPTVEGITRWDSLDKVNTFKFVNKQPPDENYVFVWRQWKSVGGKIYFDAEVGHSVDDKQRDGKYIVPKKITVNGESKYEDFDAVAIQDYLRSSDIGEKIHELYGDQMNIWPFLWRFIPKP